MMIGVMRPHRYLKWSFRKAKNTNNIIRLCFKFLDRNFVEIFVTYIPQVMVWIFLNLVRHGNGDAATIVAVARGAASVHDAQARGEKIVTKSAFDVSREKLNLRQGRVSQVAVCCFGPLVGTLGGVNP